MPVPEGTCSKERIDAGLLQLRGHPVHLNAGKCEIHHIDRFTEDFMARRVVRPGRDRHRGRDRSTPLRPSRGTCATAPEALGTGMVASW